MMTSTISSARILALAENRKFFLPPLLFNTLDWGDPFQIYGKALLILKLKFFRQRTVKIW